MTISSSSLSEFRDEKKEGPSMNKTADTISSEEEVTTARASLLDYQAKQASIGEQIARADDEIERLMVSTAMKGGKADQKAIDQLEDAQAKLTRQSKNTQVVIDALTLAIEGWEGRQGERDYVALLPDLEALYATGTELETQYLDAAHTLVRIGRQLNQVRQEHVGITYRLTDTERESFTDEQLVRIAYRGEARRNPAPPFAIHDLMLTPSMGPELNAFEVARSAPYWRDLVGDPDARQEEPDEEAEDGIEGVSVPNSDVVVHATEIDHGDGVIEVFYEHDDGLGAA